MKQRMHAKIKAFIVIVSMLFTSTVYPVTATTVFGGANSSDKYKYTESKVKNDDMQDEDEFDYGEEEPVVEDDGMILRYVDKAHFNSSKHVKRIPQLEDLNTYVFENTDGTRTIYLMYENVKFKDKNGVVKEKDITLKRKTKGYGTVQNNVDLLIPDNPVNGIDLEYSGFGIKLTPLGLEGTSTASKDDNSVEYPEAYGKNTKLKYTPLLSGIKEDIILYEYTPDASYTFILETGGLTVYSDDKGYYLADKRKTNPIFYLGDIVIYDAIGKPDVGTMKVDTIAAGRKYLLTVTANDEFLSDPDTVYPVTIDPSVTVSDNNASGSIIDAPIFKGYPNSNFGTFIYDRVGTPSASYGIGRTAIKLPGLISQNEYKGINANQIKSVYFYVREASGTSTQYINLYQLTGNTTWTETSVTWNNIGTYSTAANYGTSMGSNQWAKFDITNMVKAWKNQASLANAGFIMTNANEANDKCFLSSEYSTASYRPYVVMTYTTDVSLNYINLSINEGETKKLVATTRPSGQTVTWSTTNSTVATVSSSGVITAKKAGVATIIATVTGSDGVIRRATCAVFVTIPDGVYYIKNNNSKLCLSTSGTVTGLPDVYQYSQFSSTNHVTTRIRQMWNIHHLGNGIYSVRPMNKLNMGLDVTGTNVDVRTIGTTNTTAGVSSSAQWTISWYSDGYVFKKGGSNTYTMQTKGASTLSYATVSALSYSSSSNCRWTLTEVSSPPSGILLYNTSNGTLTSSPTKTINPKQTLSMAQMNLEVAVYSDKYIFQSVSWSSSNTNVATVHSSTGSVTGVSPGTATITARRTLNGVSYSVSYKIKVNKSAVIIIPGIMGTELIAGPNNSLYSPGTEVWSKSLSQINTLDALNRIACLICDEEGKSVYDIIPKESDYGIDSTYEALYNSLSDKYKGAYDVHFFAYDWRLSNSVSADLLNKYINDNGYENVILVCHSMGGLVASRYLALGTNQINKVETVITLGSPLLGAPIIPYLWGSEDLDSVGLLEITGMNKSYKSLIDLLTKCWDPLDTLICNFKSMYEIFPTEKYFDNSYAGSNYLFTSSSGNSRVAKTTYADTRTVLEKYLVRYNTEFINAAEQFHKSLYKDNEHITSLVNTYYIVGCNSTTTEEIEYNMSNWSICDETNEGDSVVPAWSASLGDRYPDRTFYTKMNHVGLVKDANVISFICQLLDGNTTPPSAGAIYTEVEEACQ